ncbi:serine racemase VanT catalytic subunit [Paenibacillus sp. SC116]|uniref:serine racemase VanT catalytic subunit n=1 Tax=Paenibacillus sp. SC116 TaxID=2968986 RepID=UPI00215A2DA1|nr:serine racemase VanT catalytic subunit [Paenibacillus sp. SC116]
MVTTNRAYGGIHKFKLVAAIIARISVSRNNTSASSKHRAWAEVNLTHLRHNLLELQRLLPADCSIMAVVKANAYGHGSLEVADFLANEGVQHFAVAECSEGIALRKRGIKAEILVLGYTSPARFKDLVRYRLTQTVISADYAADLNEFGKKIKVHIKIDTGMSRLGEGCDNMEHIRRMYRHANLQVTGTYSHLSMSDSQQAEDIAYTRMQIQRFYEVTEQLKAEGINTGVLHMQSSYGILNYSDLKFGLARPGIALYGVLGREDDQIMNPVDLRPVLSLKAKVTMVKAIMAETPVGYGRNYVPMEDRKIAAVSIGYADGIPRSLFENGGYVLIKGQKAKIAGNVCMDQLMIDVTHIGGIQAGETVTIIGQDGEETVTASEIASHCGTISNEILSGIGNRVERVYMM